MMVIAVSHKLQSITLVLQCENIIFILFLGHAVQALMYYSDLAELCFDLTGIMAHISPVEILSREQENILFLSIMIQERL